VSTKTFTILLSGDVVPTPRLRTHIQNTHIIAADGGIRHAAPLEVEPYIWIGDFDSTCHELVEHYQKTPRICHPVAKDSTDGALAIDEAIKQGAEKLILCGAFGGRSDQVLMHMTMAVRLAERNIPTLLTCGKEEGYPLLPGQHHFTLPSHTLFSIIAFDTIHHLTIKGAQWSGQWDLAFGSSLGLSNRVDSCAMPHGGQQEGQHRSTMEDEDQNTQSTLDISLTSGKGILLATLP